MAVLPAEIPTGLVTGQFYFVSEDNVDVDTDPTLMVVAGDVIFTCDAADPLRMPTKLATIVPLEFKAKFNAQGELVSAEDSTLGIELPASDSPLFNPTNFTWTVTFDLVQIENRHTVQIEPFSFSVPEGEVTDLTLVMPVSTEPGVITIQGPQGEAGDMVPAVGGLIATGTVTLTEGMFPSTRRYTLTGNTTLTLPTPNAGFSGTMTLVFVQDGTGNRTITWPNGSVLKWPDGIVQQPAAGANTTSIFNLMWAGNYWYGLVAGKSFA